MDEPKATGSSSVPSRLAIVGGGGVGVGVSTAWQGLGALVALLARGKALLPRMESFTAELVAQQLVDSGVNVRTGTSVTGLRRPGWNRPGHARVG